MRGLLSYFLQYHIHKLVYGAWINSKQVLHIAHCQIIWDFCGDIISNHVLSICVIMYVEWSTRQACNYPQHVTWFVHWLDGSILIVKMFVIFRSQPTFSDGISAWQIQWCSRQENFNKRDLEPSNRDVWLKCFGMFLTCWFWIYGLWCGLCELCHSKQSCAELSYDLTNTRTSSLNIWHPWFVHCFDTLSVVLVSWDWNHYMQLHSFQ